MTDFNPSYAVVKSAVVESHDGFAKEDLSAIVTKLEFTQSINNTAWFGSLSIYDTTGLLENKGFKIRGEEKLTLIVESFDLKLESPLELECQIISITNVVPTEALTGVTFDLNFISRISYDAGKRRVRDAFSNLRADEIAERVFKKFYGKIKPKTDQGEILPFNSRKFITSDTPPNGKKTFYVQESEGSLFPVIPNLIPADAMTFLAQRSFSKNSPSCTYRFFETFNGFYYVTDEWLIRHGLDNDQTIEEFAFNAVNSQDSRETDLQTNTFKTFKNPQRVNTAADINAGAYKNVVVEVDLGRRRARNIKYDYIKDAKYIDMTGEKTSLESNPHTETFIEETFTEENAKRYLVFKDYYDETGATLRANQHFPEILQNRSVYGYHLGQTVVQASLVGRLDLKPGRIIKVKVPSFTITQNAESPYNEQLSGNYMIVTISHQLADNKLNTNVTLAKYDWSGDYQE